jgi:hypothetical protein
LLVLGEIAERNAKGQPQPGLDERLSGEALSDAGRLAAMASRRLTSLPSPPRCPFGRAAANTWSWKNFTTASASASFACASSLARRSPSARSASACWAATASRSAVRARSTCECRLPTNVTVPAKRRYDERIAPRWRRENLTYRYQSEGGWACTASPLR